MPLGMNAVGRQSVLFEFDSIVDLQLGVVRTLRKDYPSGGNNSSINYDFLHKDFESIAMDRLYLYNKNIVQECFTDKFKPKYKTIYNSYIDPDGEFDRVVKLSPITLMVRLINTYAQAGAGLVKCFVRCDNQDQEAVIKRLFGNDNRIATIITCPREEVNLLDYSRIIVADVHDLDKYPGLKETAKHIAVLNYGCNLEVINNDVVILKDYIIKYGLRNNIQVIDSMPMIKAGD